MYYYCIDFLALYYAFAAWASVVNIYRGGTIGGPPRSAFQWNHVCELITLGAEVHK